MTLKTKIIHESLKLFSTHGFLCTSISDILQAAQASKGGFYNHFKTKDELLLATLSEARKLWREKNFAGLETIHRPSDKIIRILENYRDHYLTDEENLPGGCIFVNLALELSDQHPEMAREVNEGFVRLKKLMKQLLDEEKDKNRLRSNTATSQVTEMIFSGLLGACVMYTSDKSKENLSLTINALIDYIKSLRN